MRLLGCCALLLLACAAAIQKPSGQQRTFAMVKPDAVRSADAIVAMAERQGFTVVAKKTTTLTRAEAELFYREHSRRPFFAGLTDFMSSGPVLALVLEGEDAISRWRDLIGPTNSEQARRLARGSVRAKVRLPFLRACPSHLYGISPLYISTLPTHADPCTTTPWPCSTAVRNRRPAQRGARERLRRERTTRDRLLLRSTRSNSHSLPCGF
mmetsp:Transcript_17340/g.44381  ORF Transcript_17340/g.44381 Transcript_17340/m.44381 type:complete len:211 (+) Transcript_17340:50-682(+)